MSSVEAAPVKTPNTAIFLILLLPFGASTGYVGVTLANTLGSQGVSALAISSLVALGVFPQTLKVFWAPIIDTTLTAKRWYLMGALGVGVSIIAMSVIPHPAKSMGLLGALAVLSSITSSFTSMASETFMANLGPVQQGRAHGRSQAGNYAGGGLGGGLALYLAHHIQAQWVSGASLGVLCMLCALPLLLLTAVDRTHMRPRMQETFLEVFRDVWSVASSRAGLLVILLMLLPLGSSGAASVLNSKAGDWSVRSDLVASVGGVLTGVISAVACVITGYIVARFDRRTCYCLFGVLVTAVLVPMALAPRTPLAWVAGSLGYAAIIAACYTAYSAVVFEVIGKGAAATKYNLMSSVSNVPVTVMAVLEGWLYDRHGANTMFFGESALGIAAALFFGLVLVSTRRWRPISDAA